MLNLRRTSNIAFLTDSAETVDLDFGLCLVHVIFDVLKLLSNLESLFSFKFSAE